jgi:hypothetical protein
VLVPVLLKKVEMWQVVAAAFVVVVSVVLYSEKDLFEAVEESQVNFETNQVDMAVAINVNLFIC